MLTVLTFWIKRFLDAYCVNILDKALPWCLLC